MAGGLAALLDDVALIARTAAANIDDVSAAAARTSAKAAGVVVDDAAVTPRFVQGVRPARELPIIWKITKGSLRNKILIILPIALLLNAIAPWAMTPILMLGGLYLSFEGAEKLYEMVASKFSGEHHDEHTAQAESQPQDEASLVKGAIMTDLILSAEIMVISLNEVAERSIGMQIAVLLVVALVVTVGVYGAVALLVKMDDYGLHLAKKDATGLQKFGRGLITAMPKVLNVIAIIGMFAMLWVGGHILITGLHDLGWPWLYDLVHGVTHHVEHLGGFIVWLVDTFFSLIFGLVIGLLIVGIMHLVRPGHGEH